MKNPTETYMKNPPENPLDLPPICSRQVVADLPPIWVWDMSEEESLGRSRGREELRERGARLGLGVEIKILMKEIFINKKKMLYLQHFYNKS